MGRKKEKKPGQGKAERYATARPRKFIWATILFWVIAIGAAWLGSMIQYDTVIEDKNGTNTSFFMPAVSYDYEITGYIIGAAVFLVLFFLFWHLIMRGMFRPLRKQPKWCQALCFIVSAIGVVGIFVVTIWVSLYNLGMAGKMKEELLEALTLIGWSVVALFRAIIGVFKGSKEPAQ